MHEIQNWHNQTSEETLAALDSTFKGLSEESKKILSSLTPEQLEGVRKQYFEEGCDDKSMDEVLEQFEKVRERIRKIEEKALRKLKREKENKDEDEPEDE